MASEDIALETRISGYLAHRMPGAVSLEVEDLARIHGGSSQETFRLLAKWREDGEDHSRKLILRRAPEAGLVNAEHDLEFKVYSALADRGVPVPRAHYLELDPAWLDRPFFIMDLMPGKPGEIYGTDDPYNGDGDAVARNFWRHMGTLASQDHRALGLTHLRNGEDEGGFAASELSYWEAKLDEDEAVVEPVVRGAIRWLRRNLPADPVHPAISHGDFRSGNFLFVPGGEISAVLDWEMCHISDPLEDMAWALDPMWTMERHMTVDDAISLWEETSGMPVDRAALDWWRLFSMVKACSIWTTAEASFQNGTNREMIVALTAMRASSFHRRQILGRMADLGAKA